MFFTGVTFLAGLGEYFGSLATGLCFWVFVGVMADMRARRCGLDDLNFILNLNLMVSTAVAAAVVAVAAVVDVTTLLVGGLCLLSMSDWRAWAIFRLSKLFEPGLPGELENTTGLPNELLQVLAVVLTVSPSSSLLSVGVSIPLKLLRTGKS